MPKFLRTLPLIRSQMMRTALLIDSIWAAKQEDSRTSEANGLGGADCLEGDNYFTTLEELLHRASCMEDSTARPTKSGCMV
jgi:hypothetical protein